MDFHALLIKYGEIGIKGKNRYIFEDRLADRIREALGTVPGEFAVRKEQGRIYVDCSGGFDLDESIAALQYVFGIVGICPVRITDDDSLEKLRDDAVTFLKGAYEEHNQTFKIETRRAKKSYPIPSMEVNAEIGEAVLAAFDGMRVDVHEPELTLHVEIRDKVYMYSQIIPGPGGMPVGTNGRAELLLSGGIDSPVAGYMIAKRGVRIDAVYFHAPPYTSERARQKVVDLAAQVAKYAGRMRLHVVNFTDIQLYIYEKCPHDQLTIIMRRYMMKIAEHFAAQDGAMALITGESIGQVASQTIQSLAVTNEVCTMPVFRPLIGFDKQDIVDISEKIGTYEPSILPYEDCCTIFVAKHPVTKPVLTAIQKSEKHLAERIDELVRTAIETTETVEV